MILSSVQAFLAQCSFLKSIMTQKIYLKNLMKPHTCYYQKLSGKAKYISLPTLLKAGSNTAVNCTFSLTKVSSKDSWSCSQLEYKNLFSTFNVRRIIPRRLRKMEIVSFQAHSLACGQICTFFINKACYKLDMYWRFQHWDVSSSLCR